MEETNTNRKSASKSRYAHQASLAETLINQYYAYLYRLTASILNDQDEADDVVQETILRALEHWQEMPNGVGQRSWLTLLAVNRCRDRLRRRKTRTSVIHLLQTLHLAEPNKTVEDLADQNQHHSELWKAVHALDEKHRLPVMLRFIYGMSAVEIAQALQISEGTVYSRLHYAIQMLRNHLGSTFNERGKNE